MSERVEKIREWLKDVTDLVKDTDVKIYESGIEDLNFLLAEIDRLEEEIKPVDDDFLCEIAASLEAADGIDSITEPEQLLTDARRMCLALKRLRGPTDHPEHYCHRCGGRNALSWYADSDVWNKVVRESAADIPEILCPICFIELAKEEGVNPTAWRLSKEGDDPEIDKVRNQFHEVKISEAELYQKNKRFREAVKPFVEAYRKHSLNMPMEMLVLDRDFRELAEAVTDNPGESGPR